MLTGVADVNEDLDVALEEDEMAGIQAMTQDGQKPGLIVVRTVDFKVPVKDTQKLHLSHLQKARWRSEGQWHDLCLITCRTPPPRDGRPHTSRLTCIR